MKITFDNNENTISAIDLDSKKFYNVKDLEIVIANEIAIENDNSYALLDSTKFLLQKKKNSKDYELVLGEKEFDGAIDFQLVIEGNETNVLEINLNPFTPFGVIYNLFFDKITDDMYMELTKEDTYRLVKGLMIEALQHFEFPRVNIYDFDKEKEVYNIALSLEEKDIIATYMIVHWMGQQLASIELTRMKYSGSDFKFTSQANHIAKLLTLKKDYERLGFHLQRLYKRHKADSQGIMRSTFGTIMESSFNRRR